MRRYRPKSLILILAAGLALAATKDDALKTRAALRSFDGAPPVIPHEIDPLAAKDCLDCHGPGEAEAPKMSHRPLANCTQCHTPTEQAGLAKAKTTVENSFTGLASPTSGARAFAGAPPMIPHATAMRSNCLACHGPAGPAALRTSHPDRHACTQCHLVPAGLISSEARQ